jgi:hypothetical protein
MLETSTTAVEDSTVGRDRPIRALLAAPSVRLTGRADGVLPLQLQARIAALRVALLDAGVQVYSAHHDQEWTSRDTGTGLGDRVPSSFRAAQSCDVVFAYLGTPLSAAVGLELGWASALRKPLVLLMDTPKNYNNLITELESVTTVLPVVDDPSWSPSAWRHTVITALDWMDQTELAS